MRVRISARPPTGPDGVRRFGCARRGQWLAPVHPLVDAGTDRPADDVDLRGGGWHRRPDGGTPVLRPACREGVALDGHAGVRTGVRRRNGPRARRAAEAHPRTAVRLRAVFPAADRLGPRAPGSCSTALFWCAPPPPLSPIRWRTTSGRTCLDSWWNVLDPGPLKVSLDLTAAHVAGWIKWVLLLPPMLVVLAAAIVPLFAGAVEPRAGAPRRLVRGCARCGVRGRGAAASPVGTRTAPPVVLGLGAHDTLGRHARGRDRAQRVRALVPDPPDDPTGAGRWSSISTIGLGLAIGAASWLPLDHGWRGLRVPGVIVVAVGVLSFLLDLGGRRCGGRGPSGPAERRSGPRRAQARARATDTRGRSPEAMPRAQPSPTRCAQRRQLARCCAATGGRARSTAGESPAT